MKTKISGVLFILIGIFFHYFSYDYPIGATNAMGAGFYPYYLSLCLIAIGIVIFVKGVVWKS